MCDPMRLDGPGARGLVVPSQEIVPSPKRDVTKASTERIDLSINGNSDENLLLGT